MYRMMANSFDNDTDVTVRAACVDTLVEAEAFALTVLSEKLSLPLTSLSKIEWEDGFYYAYFGELLVGFCEIDSLNEKDGK